MWALHVDQTIKNLEIKMITDLKNLSAIRIVRLEKCGFYRWTSPGHSVGFEANEYVHRRK